MATLMFWNKQNGHDNKNGKKNWLHAPDNLVDGHVVYRAKFLGKCAVDQPKGIEVVKEAIRKLQLTQQMKKFEQQMKKLDQNNAWKAKKVELSVSINGVAVRDMQSQMIMHQYPLYRISYCADEKGEKKYFSFIAKSLENEGGSATAPTNGENDSVVPSMSEKEKHECFVFISSKNASDITLTIGQAFDLAYTKYKNDSDKTTELGAAQAKNKNLEKAVAIYRERMRELAEHVPRGELELLLQRMGLKDLYELPIMDNNSAESPAIEQQSRADTENLLIETNDEMKCPPVPSRNLPGQFNSPLDVFKSNGSSNGKNDELLLNSDSDSDFDPRAFESDDGKTTNDFFGFEPTKTLGQQIFSATNGHNTFVNNMNAVNTSVSNGFLAADSNNNGGPPPLLAPPPKSNTPRRSGPQQPLIGGNGKIMGNNQDLFGSTPFHNAPISFESPLYETPSEISFGERSCGSSISSSSTTMASHNPFQFFDRIDQEIEENKQKLKEKVPIIRPVLQRLQHGDGKYGVLDADYDQSSSASTKQTGYNAFFNIHFDQFSTKTISTPLPPSTTNEFSNDAINDKRKKDSDLQQNFIWG